MVIVKEDPLSIASKTRRREKGSPSAVLPATEKWIGASSIIMISVSSRCSARLGRYWSL